MTPANIFDLTNLYKEYFGKNSYYIDKNGNKTKLTQEAEFVGIPQNPHPKGKIHFSRTNQPFNKIGAYGQNIWFPVKLQGFEMQAGQPTIQTLEIDICTVSVKLSTGIVSTPLASRKGCVNEIVNLDDYKFTSVSQQNQVINSIRFLYKYGLDKKYFLDSVLSLRNRSK